MSALSDLEVNHVDTLGTLIFVRYPLKPLPGEEQTEYISVATTRPETILGDTAVAVNPRDTRYKDMVGRIAILPVIGREIPIIAGDARTGVPMRAIIPLDTFQQPTRAAQ